VTRWLSALTLLLIVTPAMRADVVGAQEPASSCPITEAVTVGAPASVGGLPFFKGRWYVNAGRTLWAAVPAGEPRSGGNGNNLLWLRPADADLVVTARRTDAISPDIRATLFAPSGEYVFSRIVFPTAGCWAITAVSNADRLTFVVQVAPPFEPAGAR
jgi:hypothetical protein